MKTGLNYMLLCTFRENPASTGIYSKRGTVRSFVIGDNLSWAKRWKTPEGICRFIRVEKVAGSVWEYSVLRISEGSL